LRWTYTILAAPLCLSAIALAIVHREPRDLVIAGVFLATGLIAWWAPEQAARAAFRAPGASQAIEGDATSERIRTSSRFGMSEVPWREFCGLKITNTAVILLHGNGIASVYPRQLFADDVCFNKFSTWARQAVPKAHVAGAVIKWGLLVAFLSATVVYVIRSR